MTIDEVKKVYTDAFPLPDDSVLDLAFCVVLNMYAKTDPLWLLIVGAPSSGKSEIIQAFYKCEKIMEISDITENSFLSGIQGVEGASLLSEIGTFGTIAMKDFTSILSYRAEKREIILGQMRQIYDGYITKKTGKGKRLEWKGKINFLGGVTEDIFNKEEESASMGRRSVLYILPKQDRFAMMRAARTARKDVPIGLKRLNIQEVFKEFIEEHKYAATVPFEVPEEISLKLQRLSDFSTIARTPVNRDRFSSKEITFVPDHEMPVRVSEQLHTFMETLLMLHDGDVPEKVLSALYHIPLDSIPKIRRLVLGVVGAYDHAATRAIAVRLGFSTGMTKRALEELATMGILERHAGQGSRGDYWAMKATYRALMVEFGAVAWVGGSLDTRDTDEEDVDQGYKEEINQSSQEAFDKF